MVDFSPFPKLRGRFRGELTRTRRRVFQKLRFFQCFVAPSFWYCFGTFASTFQQNTPICSFFSLASFFFCLLAPCRLFSSFVGSHPRADRWSDVDYFFIFSFLYIQFYSSISECASICAQNSCCPWVRDAVVLFGCTTYFAAWRQFFSPVSWMWGGSRCFAAA